MTNCGQTTDSLHTLCTGLLRGKHEVTRTDCSLLAKMGFSRKCCRDTSLSRGRRHLAASICTVQKGGDCVAIRTAFNQHMDCDQALFNQHFGSTQKLFRQHSGNVQVVLGEHLDIVYRIIRQYLGSVQTVCMHCIDSMQAANRKYLGSVQTVLC